jgi:hypothetical protein
MGKLILINWQNQTPTLRWKGVCLFASLWNKLIYSKVWYIGIYKILLKHGVCDIRADLCIYRWHQINLTLI